MKASVGGWKVRRLITRALEVLAFIYRGVVEAKARCPAAHRSLIASSKAGASKICRHSYSSNCKKLDPDRILDSYQWQPHLDSHHARPG